VQLWKNEESSPVVVEGVKDSESVMTTKVGYVLRGRTREVQVELLVHMHSQSFTTLDEHAPGPVIPSLKFLRSLVKPVKVLESATVSAF